MRLTVLLPLLLALIAAPAAALAGLLRPRLAAPTAVVTAALAFGAVLWGWASGGGAFDAEWAPSLGLRLSFTLDGLAALYSFLATGIGLAVVVYSSGYLPIHLHHQHRPDGDEVRFYAFVLLFMGSMVGLVMAQDLLLIFIFWDLTAISSYFLIGYDRAEPDSRSAAMMALLVTGITAVLFLIGSLLLFTAYGTFSLPELISRTEPGPILTLAGLLMALSGLAKSAQIPFHFWLPRAMAAPTPVSAYLHSAAMVAAGVFLLGRLYPLLAKSDLVLDALLVIGMGSMAVGGLLALTRDVMKQLLAYSTIAQYGYVVTMLGLGGATAVLAASYYVIAHALAKSALFLTAGAVTVATEENRLSHLGGLGRRMPLLAAASGLSAATLAGMPLTVGFFKDELFFAAALERGSFFPAAAVVGAALTIAYSWRFWSGVFLGRLGVGPGIVPVALTAPIVALSLLAVGGGFLVTPFAQLAQSASESSLIGVTTAKAANLAYHLDTRPENLMAVATYSLGSVLVVTSAMWIGSAKWLATLGERFGPERWYDAVLGGLNGLSSWLHAREVRDLRERVATILVPSAALVGGGILMTPTENAYSPGILRLEDLPLILAVLISATAALITAVARSHFALVLLLSGVGYSLAVVYAFFGGPDVALVAVLVETIFTLLLLGMLALFPRELPSGGEEHPSSQPRELRNRILALVAGSFALAVAWGTLSHPAAAGVGASHIALAPQAHAADVVTVILADFRGLDTMGEITVIGIGLLGVATLLSRGRLL